MRCSLDKVLLDARELANKIRASDEAADVLIKQASEAHAKMRVKMQTQEDVLSFEELSEVSKDRPKHHLMMRVASENRQLELLKQENNILRLSLKEYEITFQMIIGKFKKHKIVLKKLDEIEQGDADCTTGDSDHDKRVLLLCSKIAHLKQEIESALRIDSRITEDMSEIETKLILENRELHRLLQISEEFHNDLIPNGESDVDSGSGATAVSRSPHGVVGTVPNGLKARQRPGFSKTVATAHRDQQIRTECLQKLPSDTPVDSEDSHSTEDDDDHSSVASDASVKTVVG